MTARISTAKAKQLGLIKKVPRKKHWGSYRSREEELFAWEGGADCAEFIENTTDWISSFGWHWTYEPQRFRLPGGDYTPDFSNIGLLCPPGIRTRRSTVWVEVKGRHGRNERASIRALKELAAHRPYDICVLARYELVCAGCGQLKMQKTNRGWWCSRCKSIRRRTKQWRFRIIKSRTDDI